MESLEPQPRHLPLVQPPAVTIDSIPNSYRPALGSEIPISDEDTRLKPPPQSINTKPRLSSASAFKSNRSFRDLFLCRSNLVDEFEEESKSIPRVKNNIDQLSRDQHQALPPMGAEVDEEDNFRKAKGGRSSIKGDYKQSKSNAGVQNSNGNINDNNHNPSQEPKRKKFNFFGKSAKAKHQHHHKQNRRVIIHNENGHNIDNNSQTSTLSSRRFKSSFPFRYLFRHSPSGGYSSPHVSSRNLAISAAAAAATAAASTTSHHSCQHHAVSRGTSPIHSPTATHASLSHEMISNSPYKTNRNQDLCSTTFTPLEEAVVPNQLKKSSDARESTAPSRKTLPRSKADLVPQHPAMMAIRRDGKGGAVTKKGNRAADLERGNKSQSSTKTPQQPSQMETPKVNKIQNYSPSSQTIPSTSFRETIVTHDPLESKLMPINLEKERDRGSQNNGINVNQNIDGDFQTAFHARQGGVPITKKGELELNDLPKKDNTSSTDDRRDFKLITNVKNANHAKISDANEIKDSDVIDNVHDNENRFLNDDDDEDDDIYFDAKSISSVMSSSSFRDVDSFSDVSFCGIGSLGGVERHSPIPLLSGIRGIGGEEKFLHFNSGNGHLQSLYNSNATVQPPHSNSGHLSAAFEKALKPNEISFSTPLQQQRNRLQHGLIDNNECSTSTPRSSTCQSSDSLVSSSSFSSHVSSLTMLPSRNPFTSPSSPSQHLSPPSFKASTVSPTPLSSSESSAPNERLTYNPTTSLSMNVGVAEAPSLQAINMETDGYNSNPLAAFSPSTSSPNKIGTYFPTLNPSNVSPSSSTSLPHPHLSNRTSSPQPPTSQSSWIKGTLGLLYKGSIWPPEEKPQMERRDAQGIEEDPASQMMRRQQPFNNSGATNSKPLSNATHINNPSQIEGSHNSVPDGKRVSNDQSISNENNFTLTKAARQISNECEIRSPVRYSRQTFSTEYQAQNCRNEKGPEPNLASDSKSVSSGITGGVISKLSPLCSSPESSTESFSSQKKRDAKDVSSVPLHFKVASNTLNESRKKLQGVVEEGNKSGTIAHTNSIESRALTDNISIAYDDKGGVHSLNLADIRGGGNSSNKNSSSISNNTSTSYGDNKDDRVIHDNSKRDSSFISNDSHSTSNHFIPLQTNIIQNTPSSHQPTYEESDNDDEFAAGKGVNEVHSSQDGESHKRLGPAALNVIEQEDSIDAAAANQPQLKSGESIHIYDEVPYILDEEDEPFPAGQKPPWIPDSPLPFFGPNLIYRRPLKDFELNSFWEKVPELSTPLPMPIDMFLKIPRMVRNAHESIVGLKLKEDENHLDLYAKVKVMGLPILHKESFSKNGSPTTILIRRDVVPGKISLRLFCTANGNAILECKSFSVTGILEHIGYDYVSLSADKQTLTCRQVIIRPETGESAEQVFVGKRCDTIPGVGDVDDKTKSKGRRKGWGLMG